MKGVRKDVGYEIEPLWLGAAPKSCIVLIRNGAAGSTCLTRRPALGRVSELPTNCLSELKAQDENHGKARSTR
jgi:hypothetical protein